MITYCTAMGKFFDDGEQLQSRLSANEQVKGLRDMATTFSTSMADVRQALSEVDPPSFEDSDQLVARIDNSLQQAITQLDTARDDLADVPDDAVGSFDNTSDPNSQKIVTVGMTIAMVPLTLALGYIDAEGVSAYKDQVGRELTEQEVWDHSPGTEAFIDQINTTPECSRFHTSKAPAGSGTSAPTAVLNSTYSYE